MHSYLIGADFEENLGLGAVAAAAERAGHATAILPFNGPSDAEAIVRRVLDGAPEVVGLSIQFQHRAGEFLELARSLRAAGYRGHVTPGGHVPTLAYREVLEGSWGIDTIVLHDGEETFVALLGALDTGAPVHDVAGLALRSDDGMAHRTAGRRLVEDLDALPFVKRYRAHNRHMGVPFIPMMGGRGCWGGCSYCSITSFYRDAREHGGGRLLRLRSPENVAAEMAFLWHAAGGAGIFCFHDDNFLLPRPDDSLDRVRRIRRALDGYGVGKAAIVGKCRPDAMTRALAAELAELGVIRLYVGVENASESGGAHLGRGTQQREVREALAACREARIFCCYNLLLFEPDATLDDVRENVRFIREHADHPVNFCRAEPYYGTPLHLEMASRRDLGGSYLGYNYRIADDRTELLFRVCAAAFRERNFAPAGVANRYMGLGYAARVLEHFHGPSAAPLGRRARELTRAMSLDTAALLEKAIDLAATVALDDRETIERRTALLGLEIAAADRGWHAALDELFAEMQSFRASRPAEPRPEANATLQKLCRTVALGFSMALVGGGCEDVSVVDPAPPDGGGGGMIVDPPPPDGGTGGMGGMIVDPPPPDAGTGGAGGMIVDPPPPDAGTGGAGGNGGNGGMGGLPADPPPWDKGAALPQESDRSLAGAGPRLDVVDQWDDSSPERCVRTRDLPLYEPPEFELEASREDDVVWVDLVGAGEQVSTRWEADGAVRGDGLRVAWTPSCAEDRLRVAVRSRGGVAVKSLRADQRTTRG